ncbi:hypothetical protein AA313_de0207776 [Arthrobotrys entomopaga]|nr:hypothetical protein AA313_de0207776 [Arthrobotrys entomopaga]
MSGLRALSLPLRRCCSQQTIRLFTGAGMQNVPPLPKRPKKSNTPATGANASGDSPNKPPKSGPSSPNSPPINKSSKPSKSAPNDAEPTTTATSKEIPPPKKKPGSAKKKKPKKPAPASENPAAKPHKSKVKSQAPLESEAPTSQQQAGNSESKSKAPPNVKPSKKAKNEPRKAGSSSDKIKLPVEDQIPKTSALTLDELMGIWKTSQEALHQEDAVRWDQQEYYNRTVSEAKREEVEKELKTIKASLSNIDQPDHSDANTILKKDQFGTSDQGLESNPISSTESNQEFDWDDILGNEESPREKKPEIPPIWRRRLPDEPQTRPLFGNKESSDVLKEILKGEAPTIYHKIARPHPESTPPSAHKDSLPRYMVNQTRNVNGDQDDSSLDDKISALNDSWKKPPTIRVRHIKSDSIDNRSTPLISNGIENERYSGYASRSIKLSRHDDDINPEATKEDTETSKLVENKDISTDTKVSDHRIEIEDTENGMPESNTADVNSPDEPTLPASEAKSKDPHSRLVNMIESFAVPGTEDIRFSSVHWAKEKRDTDGKTEVSTQNPSQRQPQSESQNQFAPSSELDISSLSVLKPISPIGYNPKRNNSAGDLFSILTQKSIKQHSEELNTAKIFTQGLNERQIVDLTMRESKNYIPKNRLFQTDPIEFDAFKNSRLSNGKELLSALINNRTNSKIRDEYQYSLETLKLMRYGMDGMNIPEMKERLQRTRLPFNFPAIRYDDVVSIFFPKQTPGFAGSHLFPKLPLHRACVSDGAQFLATNLEIERLMIFSDSDVTVDSVGLELKTNVTRGHNPFVHNMLKQFVTLWKGYMRATSVPLDSNYRHAYPKQQTLYTVLGTPVMISLDVASQIDPETSPYDIRDLLAQLVAECFSCHYYNREILKRSTPIIGLLSYSQKIYVSIYDPNTDTPYVSEPLDSNWCDSSPDIFKSGYGSIKFTPKHEETLGRQLGLIGHLADVCNCAFYNGLEAMARRIRMPTDSDTPESWSSMLKAMRTVVDASRFGWSLTDTVGYQAIGPTAIKRIPYAPYEVLKELPHAFKQPEFPYFQSTVYLKHLWRHGKEGIEHYLQNKPSHPVETPRSSQAHDRSKNLDKDETRPSLSPFGVDFKPFPSSYDMFSHNSPVAQEKLPEDDPGKHQDLDRRLSDLISYLEGSRSLPPTNLWERKNKSEPSLRTVEMLNEKARLQKALAGEDPGLSHWALESHRVVEPEPQPEQEVEVESSPPSVQAEAPELANEESGSEYHQRSFFGDSDQDEVLEYEDEVVEEEDASYDPLPLAPDPGSKFFAQEEEKQSEASAPIPIIPEENEEMGKEGRKRVKKASRVKERSKMDAKQPVKKKKGKKEKEGKGAAAPEGYEYLLGK